MSQPIINGNEALIAIFGSSRPTFKDYIISLAFNHILWCIRVCVRVCACVWSTTGVRSVEREIVLFPTMLLTVAMLTTINSLLIVTHTYTRIVHTHTHARKFTHSFIDTRPCLC